MTHTRVGLLFAAALVAAGPLSAAPVEQSGRIESVTVYRGQALVTRAVALDAPAGPVELVVPDLPARVVGSSLFASSDQAQVRAVRFRQRAVAQEPREDVRRLAEQIEKIEKDLRKNQADQALLTQKQAYLTQLEASTSGRVQKENAEGKLNAGTVRELTEFLFEQRTQLAGDALALAEAQKQMEKERELLRRKRQELAGRATRTRREAVIFLSKQGRGKATIRLSYLVDGAGWSPTYNARASADGKDVALEYSALVQQTSGEDWNDVKVTLSTASPAMVAEAPILTPLWLALAAPGGKAGRRLGYAEGIGLQTSNARALQQARMARKRGALTPDRDGQIAAGGPSAQFELDWRYNEAAGRLQMVDFLAGKDVLEAGQMLVAAAEDVLSVDYPLDAPISIPSRSDQQMIQIGTLKLAGDFYYRAAPVLSPYVYQQVDVVNSSDMALLPGPVSAYLNGQFMGAGRLPMVARGQKFRIGLGVDSQLRAARELADKTDRVIGGNREMTFTYRLLVHNYKDRAVKVRLLDRMPEAQDATLRVTLVEASQEVSDEPVYQRTLRKRNVLRWEVDVPAGSSGPDAKKLTYTYKIEFDRNQMLAEPSPAKLQQKKQEFRRMLDSLNTLRAQ